MYYQPPILLLFTVWKLNKDIGYFGFAVADEYDKT